MCVALSLSVFPGLDAAATNAIVSEDEYHAAILAARAGNPAGALGVIERRYRADPANLAVAYDYIAVLSWAHRPADAIQTYERLPPAAHPAFVEEAVARDYRDLGTFDLALARYRAGRQAFPDRLSFAAGEILTLADLGRVNEAAVEGKALITDHPQTVELLSAAAYVLSRADRHADALAVSERVLALDPKNRDARRAQVFALARLDSATRAFELARQWPQFFSAAELASLGGDSAAALVRHGESAPPASPERFARIDAAIAALDQRIAELSGQGPALHGELLRAHFDRIVALRDRNRNADILADYAWLQQQNAELPTYALQAVGDAYLAERHPDEARAVYQRVLARDPQNFEARFGLFYAEVESEDFDGAYATIDALAAEHPWARPADEAARVPDRSWLRAQLAAAMARFYGGDSAEAERRVEALIATVPGNPDLRMALASVQAARQWPRASLEALAEAESLKAGRTEVAVARANIALDRGDRVAGAAMRDTLVAENPDEPSVQRLDQRLKALDREEFRLDVNHTLRTSAGPIGGNEVDLEATLYSRPIADRYRVYVTYALGTVALPEGRVRDHHSGVGVEYTGPDFGANFSISDDVYPRTHIGGQLALAWIPDDHLRLSAQAQIFSRDTPLRALAHNITADSFTMRASYRVSELESYSLATEFLTFSDGNFRASLLADGSRRILVLPHFTADLGAELYASDNSRRHEPYYNPQSDLETTVYMSATQILYRRYGFVYSHRLRLSPGYYWEQGFGGGFAGNILYEHRLRLDDDFEGALGVRFSRQPYDGKAEDDLSFIGSVDWRF